MSQLLTKIQSDFTGGLFKRYGTYLSPPNCASKLQNVRVDKGGFRQIGGYTALNVTSIGASSITSGYRAYIGTKKVTFMTAGTFMYYWTTGSTQFLSCISGLTLNSPWSFVTYNGYIYCQNGVDNYTKIDILSCTSAVPPSVSAITAVGSCPPQKSAQLLVARERIWAVGNSVYPDRAYYCSKNASGIGLPETWVSSQYLAFPRESNGLRVIGGIDWKDQAVIITDRTVSLVLGDNNAEFEIPIMDDSIGCIARRTIATIAGGIMFLNKKGVYFFSGGQCRCVSRNIQDYIDDINPTYISNAVAMADENCYYLSYTSTATSATYNSKMLIFDLRIGDTVEEVIKGGWTGSHDIPAGCFIRYYGDADNQEIYFGDANPSGGTAGIVYRFMDDTVKSFNNFPITIDVETYDYDYKELVRPDIKKQLDKVVVIAEPETAGSVIVSYYPDNATTDTAIGTVSLVTVGKERGDMSGKSDSTRTIVNHPLKVPLTVTSTVYFNRLRLKSIGTGNSIVVRSIIQTAWLIENPNLI